MTRREYRAVPLPALRTRRNRNAGEQVAEVVQHTINEMAGRGWNYLRAETVRAMESQGLLRGREEVAYTVLVFDRAFDDAVSDSDDDHAFDEPSRHARRGSRGRGDQQGRDAGREVASTPFEDDAFDSAGGPLHSSERRDPREGSRRSEGRSGDAGERSSAQKRMQDRIAARRASSAREPSAAHEEDDFRPARRRDALDDGAALGRRLRGTVEPSRGARESDIDDRHTGESGFGARAPRPDRHRR